MFKAIYVIVVSLSAMFLHSAQSEQLLSTQQTFTKEAIVVPKRTPTAPPSRNRTQMKLKDLPQAWQDLVWCESRNHRYATSPSGLHHGYFQIHEGFFKAKDIDWRGATLEEQWLVAKYVYNRQGANAWSCADYANLK